MKKKVVHQKMMAMKIAKEKEEKTVVEKHLPPVKMCFNACSALNTMTLACARIRKVIRGTCSMRM